MALSSSQAPYPSLPGGARKLTRSAAPPLPTKSYDFAGNPFVVGGGCCLVRNFGEYDASRIILNEDICATAKGYELLSESQMQKAGGFV